MKISTIFTNKFGKRVNYKFIKYAFSLIFWLGIWQFLSMIINQEILLVSPVLAIKTLYAMLGESEFWISVGHSFIRIFLGFVLGMTVGTSLAILSYRFKTFKSLLEPLVVTVQTVPVVSFIILLLIWVRPVNLSVVVSFLMVVPIFYRNIGGGLNSIDGGLLDLSSVYNISIAKRVRYLYLYMLEPHMKSACEVGIGFCFKSGIAAEVIGMPINTIGERLYQAKIYLNTSELFAWTISIIILSLVFRYFFIKLLDGIFDKLEV